VEGFFWISRPQPAERAILFAAWTSAERVRHFPLPPFPQCQWGGGIRTSSTADLRFIHDVTKQKARIRTSPAELNHFCCHYFKAVRLLVPLTKLAIIKKGLGRLWITAWKTSSPFNNNQSSNWPV
jgi:hypothetical protein